ncbi:hypothetical protein L3556_00930 [Candidatus Synechococcus calcipolaris G9]|uniref:Uncharacterized protein n=1 Tax=Candidatus Synechococcus calcipolaris G9 TaxID=1497997 RepID=A0ABT6EUF2_9SYNE|nr:hypothetical protein [Candidatus Synechococcus calcipolaris]MDG2989502.1 hypothetical protein [Candidatus Synechococcus calcipolaris G9]
MLQFREFEEFVTTISKMREAQKRYFRTKSRKALADAKLLEMKVDELVKCYNEYLNKFALVYGKCEQLEILDHE